ncbi:MAG: type II toxin-antitoxin system VapC family toxin [Bauldia sp.]
MDRFLLDANIISAAVRSPHGPVGARLAAMPGESLCTSIIVAAELRYGAVKRGSSRLMQSLEAVISGIDVVPFEAPADEVYAELRAKLESGGTPLAANDLFIAAHALTLGCVLVTDDRTFEQVPRLSVENWLR